MAKVKKIVIIVVVFMVAVLCLGGVSTLFDSGGKTTTTGKPTINIPSTDDNESPEEAVCAHIDADDNELCDVCGKNYTDGCDNHVDKDDNELCDFCRAPFSDGDEFPGTPIHVNSIENYNLFIDSYSLESSAVLGFVTYGMYQRDNTFLKLDDKFTYYTENSPSKTRFFGFYGMPDSKYGDTTNLPLDSFDYFTIDFDVSSDSLYPYVFQIAPVFANSLGDTIALSDMYTYYEGRTDLIAYSSDHQVSRDITESFHVTYLFDMVEKDFYVYINGERIFAYVDLLTDAAYFDHIRIMIHADSNRSGITESISVDNIAIYSFGNGDGTYAGTLVDVISDSNKSLAECADSVLYIK